MEYFTWPMVVLIIAIIFMCLFRKDISALLARIQKISKEGIQTYQVQRTLERESSAEELMRAFDSKVLREQEASIKKDLEDKGLSNQEKTIDVLVRHLAATQLALMFESLNTSIWGSQIDILQHLNSKLEGETIIALRSFYDYAAKMYPDTFANYPFEKYLGFLISMGLIVQSGERYLITAVGHEFLGYLVRTGRTGNRVL